MSRPRDLIVVVPGIGGSVLERDGFVIWDADAASIPVRLAAPGPLAWSSGDGVSAVGLVRSVGLLPGLTVIHGYDRLVSGLQRLFGDALLDPGDRAVAHADADIVLCPYDFRRSVDDSADELEVRLSAVLDARPERPMVVIAHSMGGLVARRWLAAKPHRRRRCCVLFTLGTPYHGSPKALDWLVNGIRLGPVRFAAATEAIRTWPSLYELLPRGPAVLDAATGEPFRLSERTLAPLDRNRVVAAFAGHNDADAVWRDVTASGAAPDLVPYVGFGHGTPQRAELDGGRLVVSKRQADWWQTLHWQGDGTVPAESTAPAELFEHAARWVRTSARHGPLVNEGDLLRRLAQVEEVDMPPLRGPDEGRPSLGLDVDEWYPSGRRIAITARLLDAAQRVDGSPAARVWARARMEGSPPPQPVPFERNGDAWTLQIGQFDPGVVELTVAATGVDGGEPRDVHEVFVVVDG